MAIYNENPNLQNYITKPYDLPIKEILGAQSARTQYYLQTLNSISQEYNSTFYKDLTSIENKENLKRQQIESEDKVQSVLKTDLSISENAKPISNLFKSISSNDNYLYDEHITKTVKEGLNQAKQQTNDKGSKYFNDLSVINLTNTLEDLRNEKINDNPKWFNKYMSNTDGLVYKPNDPEAEKNFNTAVQKMVKDSMEEITVREIDPETQISTFKVIKRPSITEWEARQHLMSNMPEHMVTNERLRARIDMRTFRQLSQTETGRIAAEQSLTQLVNNNRDNQFRQLDQTLMRLKEKLELVAIKDSPVGKEINRQIEDINTLKTKISDEHKKINLDELLEDNETGLLKLSELNLNKRVNGIIQGMGLDAESIKYENDTGHNAYILAKIAAESKNNGKGQTNDRWQPGENNPLVRDSEIPVNLGSEATGMERIAAIADQYAQKSSKLKNDILNQWGYNVSVPGKGNISILEHIPTLPQSEQNKLFKDYANKNFNNAQYLIDLVGEDKTVKEALIALTEAFENPKKFESFLTRNGEISAENLEKVREFQVRMSELEEDKTVEANKYLPEIVKYFKANYPKDVVKKITDLGVFALNPENVFEVIVNNSGVQLTKDNLKSVINLFKSNPNASLDDVYNSLYPKSQSLKAKDPASLSRINQSEVANSQKILALKNEFLTFQNFINQTVNDEITTSHSYLEYQVLSPDDKAKMSNWNKNELTTTTDVKEILTGALISDDGKTGADPAVKETFDLIKEKGLFDKYVSSVKYYYDQNSKPFAIITIKNVDELKKEFKDIDSAKMDKFINKITDTRLYFPENMLPKTGFGGISSTNAKFIDGRKHSSLLTSGGSLSVRNIGTNYEPVMQISGTPLFVEITKNGFSIVQKEIDIRSDNNSISILGLKDPNTLKQDPLTVQRNIKKTDWDASRIKSILQSFNLKTENVTTEYLNSTEDGKKALKLLRTQFPNYFR